MQLTPQCTKRRQQYIIMIVASLQRYHKANEDGPQTESNPPIISHHSFLLPFIGKLLELTPLIMNDESMNVIIVNQQFLAY